MFGFCSNLKSFSYEIDLYTTSIGLKLNERSSVMLLIRACFNTHFNFELLKNPAAFDILMNLDVFIPPKIKIVRLFLIFGLLVNVFYEWPLIRT